MNLENYNKAIEWVKKYLEYLLKINQKRLKMIDEQNQLYNEDKQIISLEEFLLECNNYNKKIDGEQVEENKDILTSELTYYKYLYGDFVLLADNEIEEIVEFVEQAMKLYEVGTFCDKNTMFKEGDFVLFQLNRLYHCDKTNEEKKAKLKKYIDYFRCNIGVLYNNTGFFKDLGGENIFCSKNPNGISVKNDKINAFLKYYMNGDFECSDSYGDNIYFGDDIPESVLFGGPRKINTFLKENNMDFLCLEIYTWESLFFTLDLLYKLQTSSNYIIDDKVVNKFADFLGKKLLEDECLEHESWGRDVTFVKESVNYKKLIDRYKNNFVKAIKRTYAIYGECEIWVHSPFWLYLSSYSCIDFFREEGDYVKLSKNQILAKFGTSELDINNFSNQPIKHSK